MCRLRRLQSGGKHAVLFWTSMLFVRFYCIYWRYRCTLMQAVVVFTVHLMKWFLIAELVWLFFRHVAHSNDSEAYCCCGPWLVYGWRHIIWRGTATWFRWKCSHTCYWSVHTSWAAVQTKRTSVMKKLIHAEEYLMVSWLQALLFMTDHHWKEETGDTTVLLLPPLYLHESLKI